MQHDAAGAAGPGPAGLPVRASDDDRARAVDALKAAFSDGRLTGDELNERVSAAYAARDVAELHGLTGDLPGAWAATQAAPASGRAGAPVTAPGTWSGPDLLVLFALLVLFPPAGIAWLIVRAWQQRHAHPG